MTLNKKLLNKKLIISYKSILNLLDHEIVAKADDTKTGDSMGNPTINGKRQRVTLKDKFYQNLADMIKAVEDNDQRYFGINRVKTAGL